MIRTLKNLPSPIRVGLVGAGCMGSGIAHQISLTSGINLEWIVARRPESAQKLADKTGVKTVGSDACQLLQNHPVDVLVEASNTIWAAYRYCQSALEHGSHVVLMNAEVDLVFGPHLCKLAASKDLVVTSDAGDQHGVLARMIQEIQLWGFDIIQAGNVKGFLNYHATAAELTHEAAKRNLSPLKCCAFTDGTKLNIEMAILANAFDFTPARIGMIGPTIPHLDGVLQAFDLDHLASLHGVVDYVLGAQPGGGVYVIGKCDDPVQHPYLEYYKIGQGPYYLFKRDYHLCHIETTTAIAQTFLHRDPILQPWAGRVTDVYAFAKSHFPAETSVPHGIGGDHFYGLIATCEEALKNNWVPIALLDSEGESARLSHPIERDQALTWDHLFSFSSPMIDLYRTPDNHAPA